MSSRIHQHFMSGCCLLAVSLFAGHAEAPSVENVKVTGQSYALQRSIDDKRASNVVFDGIAADEIGQTPEFGLGDALRQVPGLLLVQMLSLKDRLASVMGLSCPN